MTSPKPWSTCLLTSMLIRHLEARYADVSRRLDYRRILTACGGFEDIADPRAYLLDPNNWIPMLIVRDTMRACELATGEKDFAYQATRDYYRTASTRPPGFLETIALLLGDVESVLGSAVYWAPAFFNYLQLQAFTRPGETQTVYILLRFYPPIDPHVASFRFVQGNLEGVFELDPRVDLVDSQEQYSQLRFRNLINEFGDNYAASFEPEEVRVTCRATGETVVVAKPIELETEDVPMTGSDADTWKVSDEAQSICPLNKDGLAVLLPYGEDAPSRSHKGKTVPPVTALRVEQGGTLSSGPLTWKIQEGSVFDAPYSRFRIKWHSRALSASQPTSHGTGVLPSDKGLVAQLLFNHLKDLQASQRRTLSMVVRNAELTQEVSLLKEELNAQQERGGLIGNSKSIKDVLELIRTIAGSDVTVLITGETGTGKELAARLIHQLSHRRKGRFLAVNCGALVESLLESELFGHERGAFTGATSQTKGKIELAQGGTLFLDEIGDVSPGIQVKLLRVLQEKQFQRVGGGEDLTADIRIVAATNRDLEAMMEQSQFRRDLYYRLNVIQVDMPSLRERPEDISELAQHFIQRFAVRAGKPIRGLSAKTLDCCLAYRWPGNVRELENVMERALTLAPERCRLVTPDLLPRNIQEPTRAPTMLDLTDLVRRVDWSTLRESLGRTGSLAGLLSQLEWAITERAVAECGGNKSRAARALGHTYRWLRKLESAVETDQTIPPGKT